MQNFQKSIKNATKLQKCDFADYILRNFRHFLDIFENFALNMKKSNFSSANFIFYDLTLKNPLLGLKIQKSVV